MNKDLEAQLLKRKIKPTAMRLVVFDFISKSRGALSLKDLEQGLESTDKVTLFRTLKTKIPVGNTGGADVPPLRPMEIPDDLREILRPYRVGI